VKKENKMPVIDLAKWKRVVAPREAAPNISAQRNPLNQPASDTSFRPLGVDMRKYGPESYVEKAALENKVSKMTTADALRKQGIQLYLQNEHLQGDQSRTLMAFEKANELSGGTLTDVPDMIKTTKAEMKAMAEIKAGTRGSSVWSGLTLEAKQKYNLAIGKYLAGDNEAALAGMKEAQAFGVNVGEDVSKIEKEIVEQKKRGIFKDSEIIQSEKNLQLLKDEKNSFQKRIDDGRWQL
jgi:hypothetical protein